MGCSVMISSRIVALLATLLPVVLGAAYAHADTCTSDDFGKAVDETGALLRAYNQEALPKLQAKFRALAAKKGWKDDEADDQAVLALQDERIAKLDETANTLLARIDTLGRQAPGQTPDCSKLDEVRNAGVELMAVMKTKTAYLTSRCDAELGAQPAQAALPVAPTTPAPAPEPAPQTAAASRPAPPSAPASPPAPANAPVAQQKVTPAAAPTPPPPAPKNQTATSSWATTTAQQPAPPAASKSGTEVAVLAPPGVPYTPGPGAAPPQVFQPDEGYTVDDVRAATRGFFGSVSTELAAVIEHAFAEAGRPSGYILGKEGGGAFLGGLRYGEGTLYLRQGGTQKIYWHGPTLGFDVGAAGARTMFLIYKLREPDDLYRTFTGIDGSAFVVGGIGLTLLGGGGMTLAPIRSGVGVRLGANIGYVRFTPTQTWNPF